MILEELGRVKHQSRIWQCAQFLLDNQCKNGQWSYGTPSLFTEDVPTTAPVRKEVISGNPKEPDTTLPPGARVNPPVKNKLKVTRRRDGPDEGDNSNSQYAALGLRACHDAGILLPQEAINLASKWWRDSQKASEGPPLKLEFKDNDRPTDGKSGVMRVTVAEPQGWCYKGHADHKAYGSMTVGAVGSLAIYGYIRDNDGGKKRSWRKDRDLHEGFAWLASHFSVTWNPGPYENKDFAENSQNAYPYYLYAMERAGLLYGTETIGSHEWYPEGAKVLLESQKADGSWDSANDTCFAILFLRRATKPLRPVATGDTKK
jgi:hypothetical protein